MVVAETVAGVGLLKSALDIAKTVKDLSDEAARASVAIDLQQKILAAQEQQMALIEQVGDLKKQVAGFEAWESEKKRYHLHQVASGRFCYLLKRSESNSEPCHALCAYCYDQGKKCTLQSNGSPYDNEHALICPSCKLAVQMAPEKIPGFVD